jgi:hypothetical protein
MIAAPQWLVTPDYFAQLQIYSNQSNQAANNQKVHDAYIGAQQNYNVQAPSQLAAGQPLPAIPQVPLQTIYNDDGTVSHPPFPDLTPCVPPSPIEGTPTGGIAQTKNLPLNETDAILMLVEQNHTLLLAIQSKLGA